MKTLLFSLVSAIAVLLKPIASNAADKVVIGFIYVGPKDDYGYNQAHAEGRHG